MNYKLRLIIGYLIATTLVGVFSYVYLSFVPGVWNVWMVGAFAIPFLSGLFEIIFAKFMKQSHRIRIGMFRLATATITVQIILKGIYEIALTNFRGEIIYISAWILLMLIAVLVKE